MKRLSVKLRGVRAVISTGLILLGILSTGCSENDKHQVVRDLVERIAPQFSEKIVFETIESPDGKDIFELESENVGKLLIRGNNPLAMAVGLNHYLKYYCNTSVSWYADQPVELPETMPGISGKIRKEARVKDRFFLNYCTYGYTLPWWDWHDWERLIDWMALNGINMPLANTAQESIWHKVWSDIGLSDEEIRSYFSGPAMLPWHRMSNVDAIHGPLPQSYMDHQFVLQKQILERERSLGMKPVLSAFNGHVPKALQRLYPELELTRLGNPHLENPYACYMLDPMDSLFPVIQKAFMEEQELQFGTDHIYGIDPLNEMHPPSWEPHYLASLSERIYESIDAADPEAHWLQMGWLFYFMREQWTDERIEAYLTAVPQGRMTMLDYFCENTEVWKITESFYGQPYIWCYLGDFGGNTMLAGNLEKAGERLEDAFRNGGDNLTGIGSTLEGFDVNPQVYEYIFEQAWTPEGEDSNMADLGQWFECWADRRSGGEDPQVRKAWQVLLEEIYTSVPTLIQVPVTNLRPVMPGDNSYWVGWEPIEYSNKRLYEALELMLQAENRDCDAYRYDVVNLGSQMLVNHFPVLLDRFTEAYEQKDLTAMKATGEQMKALFADVDQLLSSHQSFLLGHWLSDARSFGKDEQEADFYEYNARVILTTVAGMEHILNDYGNRCWGGLMQDFYGKRWALFIDEVINAVEKGEAFNQRGFVDKSVAFELAWGNQTNRYPSEPVGNSLEISTRLIEKYRNQMLAE
ncbi:MAG: alpha-N-acetylglucosaminidase [Bacteroidota bacterium]